MLYVASIGEREFLVEIIDENHVLVDGKPYQVDFEPIKDQPIYSLLVDGHSYEGFVYPAEKAWQVLLYGRSYPVLVEQEMERRLRMASGSRVSEKAEIHIKAPMPGLVVAVPIKEGQEVERGQVLILLESMKMQNELRAPRSGAISRLLTQAGERVEQNQTLLSIH